MFPQACIWFLLCSFTLPVTCTGVNQTIDISCEQIKSGASRILCVGVHLGELLLITDTYTVLSLNQSALSAESLNLSHTKGPISLQDRWPLLEGPPSKGFSLPGAANSSHLLLLLVPGTNHNVDNHYHNELNSPETSLHPLWYDSKSQGAKNSLTGIQAFISTTKKGVFYGIRVNQTSGDLQMAQMHLDGAIEANFALRTPFYSLCLLGSNDSYHIMVMPRPGDQCAASKTTLHHWPTIASGFVFHRPKGVDHFLLFARQGVLIFPETVFSNRSTEASLRSIPYSDFLHCPLDGHRRLLSVCLIVIFSLLGFNLTLGCLLCCCHQGDHHVQRRARKSAQRSCSLKRMYISHLTLSQSSQQGAPPPAKDSLRCVKSQCKRVQSLPSYGDVGILKRLTSSESLQRSKRMWTELGNEIQRDIEKSMRENALTRSFFKL